MVEHHALQGQIIPLGSQISIIVMRWWREQGQRKMALTNQHWGSYSQRDSRPPEAEVQSQIDHGNPPSFRRRSRRRRRVLQAPSI